MNRRMLRAAVFVNDGSDNIRPYSVGTPMNTVASGILAITNLGSNLASQIILLPLMRAP